jgi:hypothetical protein
MDLDSNSSNIQHTAQLIMDAFRHFGTPAGAVLPFGELLPYLEKQSDQPQHYKDTLKEAEFHLAKTAYATPDPTGLRLTEVGFEALQQGRQA